jgi:hypothetical protein
MPHHPHELEHSLSFSEISGHLVRDPLLTILAPLSAYRTCSKALTVPKLKEILSSKDLPLNGKKEDLIARILASSEKKADFDPLVSSLCCSDHVCVCYRTLSKVWIGLDWTLGLETAQEVGIDDALVS